jgi:hypothetical protein
MASQSDRTGEDTPLSIGLAVEQIDAPSMRNATNMIRRYGRLSRGRHALVGCPA